MGSKATYKKFFGLTKKSFHKIRLGIRIRKYKKNLFMSPTQRGFMRKNNDKSKRSKISN